MFAMRCEMRRTEKRQLTAIYQFAGFWIPNSINSICKSRQCVRITRHHHTHKVTFYLPNCEYFGLNVMNFIDLKAMTTQWNPLFLFFNAIETTTPKHQNTKNHSTFMKWLQTTGKKMHTLQAHTQKFVCLFCVSLQPLIDHIFTFSAILSFCGSVFT